MSMGLHHAVLVNKLSSSRMVTDEHVSKSKLLFDIVAIVESADTRKQSMHQVIDACTTSMNSACVD